MPMREQARLAIQAAHEAVAAADRIVVLSGAGMSSESGIPTFRDAQTGLWARFDPMQLASAEGFRADPRLVWDWYAQRRAGVRAAVPNAGHVALARFAAVHPGRLHIITQNVDDLHQRAGNLVGAQADETRRPPPEGDKETRGGPPFPCDVIRLHGDILQSRWLDPCRELQPCDPATAEPERPPHCARCGNLVRPAVVWFGERLPPDALTRAEALARQCQLMLVVGTSGTVYPAAGLASLARDAGARVIVINPQASDLDNVAHQCLRGTAAAVLPLLLDGL